jgi:hypothetical protein
MLEGPILYPLFMRFQIPPWIQNKTLVVVKGIIEHESHESSFRLNIYVAFLILEKGVVFFLK